MKRRAFVVGVFGVAEADEEPALSAAFASQRHDHLRRSAGDILNSRVKCTFA